MSDLKPVAEGLEEILRRLGIPSPGALERLVADWPELAGEPWAGRTAPAGWQRGELVLEVADGATASLLRYQVPALLERLESALGARLVEGVRLRVRSAKKAL